MDKQRSSLASGLHGNIVLCLLSCPDSGCASSQAPCSPVQRRVRPAGQSLPLLPAQPVVNHLLPNCCTLCPSARPPRDAPRLFCWGCCRAFCRGSHEQSCRAGTHVRPGCERSLLPTAPCQSPSCCSSRQGSNFVFRFQLTRQCRMDAHLCPNPGLPHGCREASFVP